ncbi:MAG: phage holin family protein [Armatimonadota bacterium]
MKTVICWWTAFVVPAISTIFGGWSTGLTTLCALILLDLASGELSRLATRTPFSREKALRGAIKKFMYFTVILAAVHADRTLGTESVRSAFIIYFSAIEMSSILRHAGACGIPIPNWIGRLVDGVVEKIGAGKG